MASIFGFYGANSVEPITKHLSDRNLQSIPHDIWEKHILPWLSWCSGISLDPERYSLTEANVSETAKKIKEIKEQRIAFLEKHKRCSRKAGASVQQLDQDLFTLTVSSFPLVSFSPDQLQSFITTLSEEQQIALLEDALAQRQRDIVATCYQCLLHNAKLASLLLKTASFLGDSCKIAELVHDSTIKEFHLSLEYAVQEETTEAVQALLEHNYDLQTLCRTIALSHNVSIIKLLLIALKIEQEKSSSPKSILRGSSRRSSVDGDCASSVQGEPPFHVVAKRTVPVARSVSLVNIGRTPTPDVPLKETSERLSLAKQGRSQSMVVVWSTPRDDVLSAKTPPIPHSADTLVPQIEEPPPCLLEDDPRPPTTYPVVQSVSMSNFHRSSLGSLEGAFPLRRSLTLPSAYSDEMSDGVSGLQEMRNLRQQNHKTNSLNGTPEETYVARRRASITNYLTGALPHPPSRIRSDSLVDWTAMQSRVARAHSTTSLNGHSVSLTRSTNNYTELLRKMEHSLDTDEEIFLTILQWDGWSDYKANKELSPAILNMLPKAIKSQKSRPLIDAMLEKFNPENVTPQSPVSEESNTLVKALCDVCYAAVQNKDIETLQKFCDKYSHFITQNDDNTSGDYVPKLKAFCKALLRELHSAIDKSQDEAVQTILGWDGWGTEEAKETIPPVFFLLALKIFQKCNNASIHLLLEKLYIEDFQVSEPIQSFEDSLFAILELAVSAQELSFLLIILERFSLVMTQYEKTPSQQNRLRLTAIAGALVRILYISIDKSSPDLAHLLLSWEGWNSDIPKRLLSSRILPILHKALTLKKYAVAEELIGYFDPMQVEVKGGQLDKSNSLKNDLDCVVEMAALSAPSQVLSALLNQYSVLLTVSATAELTQDESASLSYRLTELWSALFGALGTAILQFNLEATENILSWPGWEMETALIALSKSIAGQLPAIANQTLEQKNLCLALMLTEKFDPSTSPYQEAYLDVDNPLTKAATAIFEYALANAPEELLSLCAKFYCFLTKTCCEQIVQKQGFNDLVIELFNTLLEHDMAYANAVINATFIRLAKQGSAEKIRQFQLHYSQALSKESYLEIFASPACAFDTKVMIHKSMTEYPNTPSNEECFLRTLSAKESQFATYCFKELSEPTKTKTIETALITVVSEENEPGLNLICSLQPTFSLSALISAMQIAATKMDSIFDKIFVYFLKARPSEPPEKQIWENALKALLSQAITHKYVSVVQKVFAEKDKFPLDTATALKAKALLGASRVGGALSKMLGLMPGAGAT